MNAIILAGGKGSRLAPWHTAKCLMPVAGVTILQRLLSHLLVTHAARVERAVVCTGCRAADVEASVAAHGWPSGKVAFSHAGEEAQMGARLLEARKALGAAERVLICYGDELVDVDVGALLEKHGPHRLKAITFAATYATAPGGEVECAEDDILQCIVDDAARYVNIGFAVVEPECWALLRPEDGLSTWINRVSEREVVSVYYHEGRRATVNTLADLEYAESVWR